MINKNLSKLFFALILTCTLHAVDPETIFTNIYINAVWGYNNAGEGFSGGGSLLVNARRYIQFLEKFITSHDIKSIVDAGCGDWEFSKHVQWNNAKYIGYDVVKHIIDKNNIKYANDNIRFVHGNAIDIDLPSADLLLCKDVLQHLSNNDILKFIEQTSKFTYCLITNDIDPITPNNDIATGECRKIDLSKAPFHLKGTEALRYRDTMGVMKSVLLIDNSHLHKHNLSS